MLRVTYATYVLVFFCLATALYVHDYKPDVAPSKMTLPDGLTVKLFASELEVRQPILVKTDDRGRL